MTVGAISSVGMPQAALLVAAARQTQAITAIQKTQAAGLEVATKLEQGFRTAAASAKPGLGQFLDIFA